MGLNTVTETITYPFVETELETIGVTTADFDALQNLPASQTGTGDMVLATTPTLVTPVLGAATGTSVSVTSNYRALSGTATTAGGAASPAIKMGSTANVGWYFGSGAPSVSAGQGSLYTRTDGSSSSTRLYVNSDGGTTWVAVTTAS